MERNVLVAGEKVGSSRAVHLEIRPQSQLQFLHANYEMENEVDICSLQGSPPLVEVVDGFDDDDAKSVAASDGLGLRCYVPPIPQGIGQIGLSPRATYNLIVNYGCMAKDALKLALLKDCSIISERMKMFYLQPCGSCC